MQKNFTPGAIKKLTIHNFQTYNHAEFNFHPKLNFIAGPNGSGKSTIANSIAFVFGGTPKLLGKAKEIKDFVKFKTDNGYVEVVVQGFDGLKFNVDMNKNANKYLNKDITIRRSFSSHVNATTWSVNGAIATLSSVKGLIAQLKIDIANICNFLPQEKVSDFSKSTPEELFLNILNVIKTRESPESDHSGYNHEYNEKDDNNYEKDDNNDEKDGNNNEKDGNNNEKDDDTNFQHNHEKISQHLMDLKTLKQKIEILESERDSFGETQKSLKTAKHKILKDIKNMKNEIALINERDSRIRKIKIIENKKEWLYYEMLNEKYKIVKSKIKGKKDKLSELRAEVDSLSSKIGEISKNRIFLEVASINDKINSCNNSDLHKFEDIKKKEHEIEKLKVEIGSLEKQREKRNDQIDELKFKIREDIEKFENIVIPRIGDVIEEFVANEKNNFKLGISKIATTEGTVHDDHPSNSKLSTKSILDSLNEEINKKEEILFSLKRRMNEIQRSSEDLLRQMETLSLNKKKHFEEGSRRLEMLKRYHQDTYKAVLWLRENRGIFEHEIVEPLFLTLNVKNQAFVPEIEGFLNFQLLSSFICKSQNDFEKFMHLCKEKQRLAINACELKSHVPASGMSSSEVRALGFDGFLIDFVSGRPEVMDFLRVFGNFASIPVAKNHVDDDMVFKKTGFRRIAIQGRYYEIKRSRYSQGNSNDYVIIQNPLPKVNLFTNFISNEQLKEIDEEFALKDAIRRDNQATYKKILEEVEVVSMQLDRATARRNEFKKKIGEIKKIEGVKEHLSALINANQLKVDILKSDRTVENSIEKIEIKMGEIKEEIKNEFNVLKENISNVGLYKNIMEKRQTDSELNIKQDEINNLNCQKMLVVEEISFVEREVGDIERNKSELRERIIQSKRALRRGNEDMIRIFKCDIKEKLNTISNNKFNESDNEKLNEKNKQKLNVSGKQRLNVNDEPRLKEIHDKKINEVHEKEIFLEEKDFSDFQRNEFEKLPDKIEELEEMIATEKAKLAFIGVNDRIVDDFREKEKKLEELNLEENTLIDRKKVINEKLMIMKREMVFRVNKIVKPVGERFECFFKRIGYDGRVEFFYGGKMGNDFAEKANQNEKKGNDSEEKVNDFEQKEGIISPNKTRNINIDETDSIKNWRLNIFVKFRKNENFEILSAYRHSGGERSVSTIIFLLSLLDSIQSPFRLVDEINQGMDRFNEKKVHDLLVSLSENERSPQFFIITPKIVPGLVYNERMKVFVLFPGVDVQEKFDDYRFRVVNCEGGLKGV